MMHAAPLCFSQRRDPPSYSSFSGGSEHKYGGGYGGYSGRDSGDRPSSAVSSFGSFQTGAKGTRYSMSLAGRLLCKGGARNVNGVKD